MVASEILVFSYRVKIPVRSTPTLPSKVVIFHQWLDHGNDTRWGHPLWMNKLSTMGLWNANQ